MLKQQPSELKPLHSQAPGQPEAAKENPSPCLYLLVSWLMFLLVFAIYAGIWAVSRYVNGGVTLASFYYLLAHPISEYVNLQSTTSGSFCSSNILASQSTSLYTTAQLQEPLPIALSLVFSWLMWKLPLALYMLQLVYQAQNRVIKYVSWGVALLVLLATDILLTIFITPAYITSNFVYTYTDYMFYFLAVVMILLVGVINNRQECCATILAAVLPPLYIALLYFCYAYLLPLLYDAMVTGVPTGYAYLMVYGYPVLDLLFYAGLLGLNARGPLLARPLLAVVHFFLLGYLVGFTMLTGVIEVEFYYLCAYMLFRNFFTNWVMHRWEDVVNLPDCLPGWGLLYYFSYATNFLPLIGVGPLVVSRSFQSYQFSQSCLLLYNYPTGLFPYATSISASSGFNQKFQGYVMWPAGLIIWAFSTFTQKYPRRLPTFFDLFYYLAGVYMFYIGISAGLQLLVLRNVGLAAMV